MRGLSAFLSVATCPIPSAASTGRKKRPARKLTLWLTVLLSAVACSLPTAIAQGAPVNGTLPRPLAARARSQHRNRIGSAPVTPGVPFIATPNVPASGMQSLASNQIIFSAWNAGNASTDDGDRVEQFGVSGASEISASTIDLGDGSQSSYSGLNYIISGIAVDAAKNEYFAVVDNLAPTYAITIQRGSLSGTGGVTTVFTIPFPDADDPNNADNTFVILGGLAIDPQTNTLYYAQAAENAATGDTVAQSTGIYQAAIQADGSISSPTLLTNVSAGLVNPDYVVLDPAADLAFFTDSIEAGGGFPATENLDEVNLITGHVAVLIENFFPTTDQNDLLQGLAINGNTLYLATVDYGDNTSTNNQILSIPLTISGSGSTATATAGTPTTLYSGTGADQPIDIVIDPAHSIFYTTGEQFVTTGEYYGAVYEGSLSGGTSLTQVLSMSTIVTNGDAAQDTDPSELVLLTQPVIAAGATANTITGAGAVTADSGVTVSDLDGQNLASAAISGALTGDTLSYNSGNPFTFTDGFTIAGSFSNGALTLSGKASPVDYQTALDSVTFSTTSTNTTARTLDWTVSDGIVGSADHEQHCGRVRLRRVDEVCRERDQPGDGRRVVLGDGDRAGRIRQHGAQRQRCRQNHHDGIVYGAGDHGAEQRDRHGEREADHGGHVYAHGHRRKQFLDHRNIEPGYGKRDHPDRDSDARPIERHHGTRPLGHGERGRWQWKSHPNRLGDSQQRQLHIIAHHTVLWLGEHQRASRATRRGQLTL